MCEDYGKHLVPEDPLGYFDSQLLVAFQDHTPDNTLPILWYKNDQKNCATRLGSCRDEIW